LVIISRASFRWKGCRQGDVAWMWQITSTSGGGQHTADYEIPEEYEKQYEIWIIVYMLPLLSIEATEWVPLYWDKPKCCLIDHNE
jgi:hypothetical protein